VSGRNLYVETIRQTYLLSPDGIPGIGLMLSGHTHNGQIWPFNYVVKSIYPFIAGKYDMNGMPLIVCRGTGTWGPRMRL
jgi:predicted MPP superfamily phosphohydrolase